MADPNPPDIAEVFNPRPDAVIETHISRVFLSGDRAWKQMKAVTLPYVDFSGLAQREQACRREIHLNRRTAPELYIAAHAVSRDASGRLVLDGTGAAVEWLVEMRRFDPAQTLDRVSARGELGADTMDALADEIARFHNAAPMERISAEAALAEALAVNELAFRRLDPDVLPAGMLQDYRDHLAAELVRMSPVLAARQSAGRVRRGHGDLHLRNIVLIEDRPVLFDCLEFDDRLATGDTLYDVAFLLMDLLASDRRDLASRTLNRYLDATGDYDGLPLLPLYIAVRAAVRCHIAALRRETREEALRYLALARAALHPVPARLVAIGGFSGSGKSTAARRVAPDLQGVCGAAVLRSDVIRKQLLGAPLAERLPASAYTVDTSTHTYARLGAVALRLLSAGCPVILDAVFGREEERLAAEMLAAEAGVGFAGFWLDAPEAALATRVTERRNDASDATAEVVRWQARTLEPPARWRRIDASVDRDRTATAILQALPPGWRQPETALE